ncbi:hypothetical protein [Lederbergia panacisoli]|nr:hypothetical protein [Lederbergia panacisoli]MCR2821445.1 hypothetical protein [Lederbergia panacisoli]
MGKVAGTRLLSFLEVGGIDDIFEIIDENGDGIDESWIVIQQIEKNHVSW